MRQVSNWCARVAAIAGTWLLAASGARPGRLRRTAAAGLQPYTARYQVSYRGLNGGEIESSFKRGTAAGQWQYETRVFPTLLARVAISSQAHELSVIQATAAGIRPLSFNFNDGSASSEKDVRLDFDWKALTVTGTFEGKPVSLPLTPGTHDTSSVQAAMIQELLAGRKPQGFKIITGRQAARIPLLAGGHATGHDALRAGRSRGLGEPAHRLEPRHEDVARGVTGLRAGAGDPVPEGQPGSADEARSPAAAGELGDRG